MRVPEGTPLRLKNITLVCASRWPDKSLCGVQGGKRVVGEWGDSGAAHASVVCQPLSSLAGTQNSSPGIGCAVQPPAQRASMVTNAVGG